MDRQKLAKQQKQKKEPQQEPQLQGLEEESVPTPKSGLEPAAATLEPVLALTPDKVCRT